MIERPYRRPRPLAASAAISLVELEHAVDPGVIVAYHVNKLRRQLQETPGPETTFCRASCGHLLITVQKD